MKKMLSLAAMCAVLAYASPASAELKLSGDASVRVRGEFASDKYNGYQTYWDNTNDLNYAYRLRLKAAADLGNGYFAKAVLTTDATDMSNAGGWVTVGSGSEPSINISQLYVGRMQENCHFMVGRLPLNSMNNPIFDLAFMPFAPVDIPVATYMMDRVYGFNYGHKLGDGEFNATFVVADNQSTTNSTYEGDGFLNDGSALHLSYKGQIGDVTIEPQAIITLTNLWVNRPTSWLGDWPKVYSGLDSRVTPYTYGANISFPAGSAKIGLSGFYTTCDDTAPSNFPDVNYHGYLLRLKGEIGNFMAWIDYNQTSEDRMYSPDRTYKNLFVWAQYTVKVHESAAGTFSLVPTVRYWNGEATNGAWDDKVEFSRLRTELVATMTF